MARAKTPLPGQQVRGSKTGRPIMALFDLLGRRTCLRILWELRNGPLSFRALAEAATTNPGVLNTRLAELREARIVAAGAEGYALTHNGSKLLQMLSPLSKWADQWAEGFDGQPDNGM